MNHSLLLFVYFLLIFNKHFHFVKYRFLIISKEILSKKRWNKTEVKLNNIIKRMLKTLLHR